MASVNLIDNQISCVMERMLPQSKSMHAKAFSSFQVSGRGAFAVLLDKSVTLKKKNNQSQSKLFY